MVGIFDRVCRQHRFDGDFVFAESLRREAVVSRKLSANPTLRALGPAVERESWKIILLSQLHPLFPTSLLNYFYGLTRIRFSTYMLWASIGRMPGLFFYAYWERWGSLQCASCAAKVTREQSSIGFGAARS
jgi:Uncharacterized conserved protein